MKNKLIPSFVLSNLLLSGLNIALRMGKHDQFYLDKMHAWNAVIDKSVITAWLLMFLLFCKPSRLNACFIICAIVFNAVIAILNIYNEVSAKFIASSIVGYLITVIVLYYLTFGRDKLLTK